MSTPMLYTDPDMAGLSQQSTDFIKAVIDHNDTSFIEIYFTETLFGHIATFIASPHVVHDHLRGKIKRLHKNDLAFYHNFDCFRWIEQTHDRLVIAFDN